MSFFTLSNLSQYEIIVLEYIFSSEFVFVVFLQSCRIARKKLIINLILLVGDFHILLFSELFIVSLNQV